jgi:rRNA maturation RNase YbeY
MIEINIFNDTERKRLPRKCVAALVEKVLKSNKIKNAGINIVYVSDEKILDINKKFLKHNYVTDVITFDLDEEKKLIGEIYISADTAERQAKDYKVSLKNELKRLAVHGALHLAGYDDSTDKERAKMTELENKFLGITNV